ncbi:MAG TPA: endonuclease/exonuclease/phosphatase family protein [Flavobacterium sp.]|nr:endonuclease/exonuclease/phosphatase family protein [Flavobacterium sp.]
MKNLSWANKIMFFLNIVLTILTFLAYILPFLAPKLFPFLSVLTLVLPLMLIFNLFFFIYWGIQMKRQILLSSLVLLMGITFINKFYKFSGADIAPSDNDFTVMSYNVRLFNLYKWIPRDDVPELIEEFIKDVNPDILCIQEYSEGKINLRTYQHKYILMKGENTLTGQAIFSKYPIIGKGDIVFPNSSNNAIYADIKRGQDTIRVYNMHLQSIKITPDVHELNEDINGISEQKSKKMIKRMSLAFKAQQEQAEILMNHKKNSKFAEIICGDMNNSAFSFVYRSIRGNLNDAFEEAGTGFGKSYDFNYYPARIDYIFADKKMQVKKFENYPDFINSDHFPIVARLSMPNKRN